MHWLSLLWDNTGKEVEEQIQNPSLAMAMNEVGGSLYDCFYSVCFKPASIKKWNNELALE